AFSGARAVCPRSGAGRLEHHRSLYRICTPLGFTSGAWSGRRGTNVPRDIRSAPAPSHRRWTCGPGAELESILTDIIETPETNAPTSFAELMLAPELLRAVADAGYTTPTPIQARAIPLILRGRDIMGLAQTGTGKTAAFTLPIVQRLLGGPRRARALILTPTRELAVQVRESFAKYAEHSGLAIIDVYGGVPLGPQEQALRAGVDVIVATPGRLLDHMERQNVAFDDLEVLVLDEADRMLDMGFAPQLNRIVSEIPKYRQTLLFSATMPPEVEALARKYLRKPIVVQVGMRTQAASTVTHAVYPVPRDRKSELLVELLRKTELDSVLVFTRTKHGADKVVRKLDSEGISSLAMHSEKSQGQRTDALDQFKKGTIRVLVATDIAQRGLDIAGISHVINYDVPAQAEDYVHRIGRTGRAAATGDAFTFMAADEISMVRLIERTLGQPIPRISVPGYDFGTVAVEVAATATVA
ncbi:MAG: box helicase domain protein, partial [Gemmatimonadetes bacterium]|nr:box helicase domain protein [Gemmatimonadota bacterium]